MQSTSSKIREYINNLPDDTIFATRELLVFGRRNAVDMTTYKMVTHMEITRLANGLFMKYREGMTMPSINEIARAKAKAFGKEIKENGIKAAVRIGLLNKRFVRSKWFRFSTNGCTSSFNTVRGQVFLQSTSRRKFQISSTNTGDLLKACWFIGNRKIRILLNRARFIMGRFGRKETWKFREEIKVMPAWLYDLFYPLRKRRSKITDSRGYKLEIRKMLNLEDNLPFF